MLAAASIFVIFLTLACSLGLRTPKLLWVVPKGAAGTYTSITSALNAVGQIGPITFVVTGTCNENVSLTNAQSRTFIAGPGGAKIVQPQDSNTFDIGLLSEKCNCS